MGSILTDAEIDGLLLEAETRLREKAAQALAPSTTNEISIETGVAKADTRKPYALSGNAVLCALLTLIFSLPKLRHGLQSSTYIKDNHGVAETNPRATVGPTHIKLANSLKQVGIVEKSKKIVRVSPTKLLSLPISHEEIISHFHLDANPQPILVCLATMRVLYS